MKTMQAALSELSQEDISNAQYLLRKIFSNLQAPGI
jgi:hypothetical protein